MNLDPGTGRSDGGARADRLGRPAGPDRSLVAQPAPAPAFRLRPARPRDAGPIADVLLASRRAFLPYAPLAHDEADVRNWVREVLVPATRVTVACAPGGEVVAFVSTQPARTPAADSWIEQLYVAPAHVGRGLGGRLLRHALATLPRPVCLHTFQANVRARAFYERHGFVALAFGDGRDNEEGCPDVRYELGAPSPSPSPCRRAHPSASVPPR